MVQEEYYNYSLSLLGDMKSIMEHIAQNQASPSESTGNTGGGNVYNFDGNSIEKVTQFIETIGSIKEEQLDGVDKVINSVTKLGKELSDEEISTGIENVGLMGTNIKALAMNLAISTPLLLIGVPAALLAIPMIRGLGGVISSLDSDRVHDGTRSLRRMGFSLLIFSGSLALSSLAFAVTDYAAVGMGVLTIGAMAIAYSLVGQLSKKIMIGTLALGLVSLSNLLFAASVIPLSDAITENPAMLWQLPALIGGIGTVYGIAGMAASYIALGAIALGAVGGSLWLIGKGLSSFKEISDLGPDGADDMAYSIKSIISGITSGFSSISLKDAVTVPLKIPAVLLMSGALVALSSGVNAYANNTSDWTMEDAETLEYTISSVSKAFAIAGSTDGANKVFGFKVGRSDIERGAMVVRRFADTLDSLTVGVSSWKNMALSPSDTQSISDNIQTVLNIIPASFAVIGAAERGTRESISIGSLTIPSLFSKGDTELGIKSVKRLGTTLSSLSDGVAAWKNKSLTAEEVQLIGNNIQSVLNVIPSVFATIGQRERGTTGDLSFFGINFRNPFSSGDIELGIKSVSDLGGTLSSMYDGIFKWNTGGELNITPATISDIGRNIETFLFTIPKSFAAVGRMESETEGILWGDGDLNKGIDIVTRLVPILSDVAGIINKIQGVETTPSGVYAITDSVAVVAKSIAANKKELESIEDLVDPFSNFVRQLNKFVSFVEKYIDIVNDTDKDKMVSHTDWLRTMMGFGDVNSNVLRYNLESMRSANQIIPDYDYVNRMRNASVFVPTSQFVSPPPSPARVEESPPATKSDKNDDNSKITEMLMQQNAMLMDALSNMQVAILDLTKHMKNGTIRTKEVDPNSIFDG